MQRCKRCSHFGTTDPYETCIGCGYRPPVRVEVRPEPEHEQPKAPPVAAHAASDPSELTFDVGGEG